MKVTIDISPGRIADLIVGAVEGGSNYWCEGFHSVGPIANTPDPWYSTAEYYEKDFQIKVVEFTEGEEPETHILNRESFLKGLQLMAEKSPNDFADFIGENDDAGTSDVFLQYATFGEIRYG